MPKLSQMPFVNGDAFSNIGAGASGINNFFGQLLAQAQTRQNMKNAVEKLAMAKQLLPYQIAQKQAYVNQTGINQAMLPVNMQLKTELAKKYAQETDPAKKLQYLHSLYQLANSEDSGAANVAPTMQQTIPRAGVIKDGNGDLVPTDSTEGRNPDSIATMQNNAQASPNPNNISEGQFVSQAANVAAGLPAIPMAQQQAMETKKAADIEQNKANIGNSNDILKRATDFPSEWSDIDKALQIISNNKNITGWFKGNRFTPSISDSRDLAALTELSVKMQAERAKSMGSSRGPTNMDLILAKMAKINPNATADWNIGNLYEARREKYNEIKQNKDLYKQLNNGAELPVKMGGSFEKYEKAIKDPNRMVDVLIDGKTERMPYWKAQLKAQSASKGGQ